MKGKGFYHFTNNATVAAIIGALVGLAAGYIVKDIQVHDAVTYNNISSYIESMLVEPGYVSEEVLSKETPFAQIEFIGQDFSGKLKEADDKSDKIIGSVQSFLIETGEDADSVEKMGIEKLEKELKKKSSNYKTIKSQLETAEKKNEEYEKLTMAELETPVAIISGEEYSNPAQDYRAVINGHNYYLDDFLNSFLEYDLVYEGGTLYYHKSAPERVRLSEKLIYDLSGNVRVLAGNEKDTMELEEYNNGLEYYFGYNDSELKISCKRDYSEIEFKLGHIDNGSDYDRDIVIYYQDDEGDFVVSKKFHCTGDMPVNTYSVPIYNTNTIKITSTGYGEYLMADIYLLK